MLAAYRQAAAARAALGIPPLPLTAQETAALVELLISPPADEDPAFLLDLLTNRVPPGVDDASRVKASFLAAVAEGSVHSPLLTRERAAELLGTMQGGYNVKSLIDLLDDATLAPIAAQGLKHTLLLPIYLPEDYRAPFVDPLTATGPAIAEILVRPAQYQGQTLPVIGDILSPRDIVATIQAEQDEAIRAPYQGVTIIGGGPGTGKTVVALHRAAYLLYTNRARLEKGGVLVVGPSSVFMNYIERVLPSLGEESVTLRAVGAVAGDVLGMISERVDAAPAATLKGSLRMLKVLRRLVRRPPSPAAEEVQVSVKGEVLKLDAVELAGIRESVLSNYKMNRGRAAATASVARALAGKLTVDVALDPEEIDERIRDHQRFREFMDSWWPMLDAPTVLARLADRELLDELAPNLTARERDDLAESYQWLQTDDVEITGWSVADMALLDELLEMLGPVPAESHEEPVFIDFGNVSELVTTSDLLRREHSVDPDDDPQTTYAHILVDESQDVTPMQWRMLRRRGPQASWTLVGDPAQSSYPDAAESERAVSDLVGRAPLRRFTLSTNYRSPSEVFDLAAKVITRVFPDASLPRAVRNTGLVPKLAETDEAGLAEAIIALTLGLAGHVSGTVGIIVPPSRLGATTRLAMSDPRLAALEERLLVVTSLQAKGLEYDGVLVVCPDEIVAEAPGAERVLYVALTRATQRMTILDVGTSTWRAALS